MEVPFVELKGQYNTLDPEIDEALGVVVEQTSVFSGRAVPAFEEPSLIATGGTLCGGGQRH